MSPAAADPAGPSSTWDDACTAARLFAVDPAGLGGVWLRARAGPVRDGWLALLRSALPPAASLTKVPLHATDERLLGGLDLAATLATGRPVASRGILAAGDGGIIVLPSAERTSPGTAARIASVLDTGEVSAERDGLALRSPARIAVVAMDEGIEPDERPPAALADRMAFQIDLDSVAPGEAKASSLDPAGACVEGGSGAVAVPDGVLEAMCAAAWAFGIASLRAPILAVRVARAAAALGGRAEIRDEDVALAARLVLAPRATRLPAEALDNEAPPPDTPPPPAEPPQDDQQDDQQVDTPEPSAALDELVLAAIAAALPAGLLAQLRLAPLGRGQGNAGSGAQTRTRRRGRPAGTFRGDPVRGARLNLIETLRAAAPWQPLRRAASATRLVIRRDDLRITRFKHRRETTTVFVVDASGSTAFQRLAEAKGAVELLLADCYARRDRVALLSFRGSGADLLLPPTRSLARAKRSLAALPGGGGTPLAAAIDEAATLADAVGRSGGSALLVFLTDGRANVGRDGRGGRGQAVADANAAAARLRAGRATILFIDTSPRPQPAAAEIAASMGARYLPLPAADARILSGAVRREIAAGAEASGR